MDKLKIAVSACLLGHNVRYNKTNKYLPLLQTLEEFEYIPICPEVTAGFGVPRPSIQLEEHQNTIRLIRKADQQDVSTGFCLKNNELLKRLKTLKVKGFILKSKSPSCGINNAKLLGQLERIDGLFTSLVRKEFPNLPLITDIDIEDETLRTEFITACEKINHSDQGLQ